jgi:hypothetical protein
LSIRGAAGPHISHGLNRLTHLRTLRINSSRQVGSVQGYWLKELTDTIDYLRPTVVRHVKSGTLRHLCAFSELFLVIPVHLLHNLTRLDLWTPSKMTDAVETVFARARNLQALTLACVDFVDMFQHVSNAS